MNKYKNPNYQSEYRVHKVAILAKAKEKYKAKKIAEENKENEPESLDALSGNDFK